MRTGSVIINGVEFVPAPTKRKVVRKVKGRTIEDYKQEIITATILKRKSCGQ